MAELGDGGGGGGGRAAGSSSSSSSSAKSDVVVKVTVDGEQGYGSAHMMGQVPVGPTMLGTVDLSGILSIPASSSSYNSSRAFPSSSSIAGPLPTSLPAPKRQQTIIVVTAVLTGYVAPSPTGYMAPVTSVAPAVSYSTATSNLPLPMPIAMGVTSQWATHPTPISMPHSSYSYDAYNNNSNPNYFPPPASSNYYQQTPHPWTSAGNPMSYSSSIPPPPPPAESVPLPPPPATVPLPTASTPAPSPWMTSAEQQSQGYQGISYNYMTDR